MSDVNDERVFGLEDEELDRRFAAAVRRANGEKLMLGVPLPKHDASTKRAYLLYEDGTRSMSLLPKVMAIAGLSGSGRVSWPGR